MPILDNDMWAEYVKANDDPYGGCCIQVAGEAMRLLDLPEHEKFDASKIVSLANKNLGAGITGFMAGAVASMISQCHSRGGEFRDSWNKAYGVESDKGIVNPAILEIK